MKLEKMTVNDKNNVVNKELRKKSAGNYEKRSTFRKVSLLVFRVKVKLLRTLQEF